MVFVEIILIIGVVFYAIYRWLTVNHDHFKKLGVPYVKPYPFLGSFTASLFGNESFFDQLIRFYMEQDSKIFGFFQGRIPALAIKDTELIKQITVKDFDHFVNHLAFVEPEDDVLFGNNLFVLKDQKWKDMRATLSPAFTGSKMRLMFQLVKECCDEAIKVLKKRSADNGGSFDIDVKDFINRYSSDVIASSAFGLKINSISGESSEFFDVGKNITNFGFVASLKFMLLANCKSLMRFLGIKLFPKKYTDYFVHLVIDTMKYRKENDIHRPDMIDMLIEAQKNSVRNWTDEEIVAQCFLFFFAGFETTAILMCFAAHELMENPEYQEKLFDEIKQVKEDLDGKPLNYEALKGMKYMDMIINETLRKWPPVIATDRACSKPYTLKSESYEVQINIGDIISIPVAGLHYDPAHFSNPKKFDPERFNDENKAKITPHSYCPFGNGPRLCIGSRLALMEAKAIIFYILNEFELKASPKTCLPMQLQTKGFQVLPKGGFWLKFVPRN